MDEVERLCAIEEIRNLQARYVRLADEGRWRALADLFLPDGTFTPLGLDGKPLVVMEGREAIFSTISSSLGAAMTLHRLFSHEIEVLSSTRAFAVWAMEDWVDRSGEQADPEAGVAFRTLHGRGHYHVDYEKRGGEWFIARQKLHRSLLEIET